MDGDVSRGGHFDQSEMLRLLDDMLVGHDSPRIRMWCDMGWAADRADVAEHLIEFEARANFIHAHHEHVVICSYEATRFDGPSSSTSCARIRWS